MSYNLASLPKIFPSRQDLRHAAQIVAEVAAKNAPDLDHTCVMPLDELVSLQEQGLLRAPLPPSLGGSDLGSQFSDPFLLLDVLSTLGEGSLPLGRLYEGHVNAVKLVRLYGTSENVDLLATEIEAGRLSGVWMAEAGKPLTLESGSDGDSLLHGQKILCSGAGLIRRPLVAAGDQMALPYVGGSDRVDLSSWKVRGMRATQTGTVNFDGIPLRRDEIVGQPGDYLRSPFFRGGAWRVLAVQLGGVNAVLKEHCRQLRESGRRGDRIQQLRFSEAKRAAETARLWVREACLRAEGNDRSAAIDAYVDLARGAFTEAAITVIDRAERAIGLAAFTTVNPLDRLTRDLSTYLRQPALDASSEAAAIYALSDDDQ